jgi:hypothetical protein
VSAAAWAARIALGVLAFTAVVVGGWATLAPQSFYDDFPGLGRTWVALDGPYNEHLVRDVGQLYLAMALVTVTAIVWLSPRLVRVVAVAWLIQGVPHLVYHLRHRDVYETSDQVANLGGLAIAVVAAIVPLLAAGRISDHAPSQIGERR